MSNRSLVLAIFICLNLIAAKTPAEPYAQINSSSVVSQGSSTKESNKAVVKEYVFSRPKKNKPKYSTSSSYSKRYKLYRVKVKGQSYQLLMRVRKIATGAFISHKEGGFIQAGLFKNLSQANLVAQKLAKAKIKAKVVENIY